MTLLAQTEVGELREGGRGSWRLLSDGAQAKPGSGRVGARVRAPCSRPGCDDAARRWSRSTSARPDAWQAEWGTLTELLTLTGSAAAWVRDLLEHLELDTERMRANLILMAEAGVSGGR